MHPALVFGLVVCGTIVVYGGIELANNIYERYSEQSQYYEHVRSFNEKRRNHSPSLDDDDDEDDTVLQSAWNRAYDGLRLRRSGQSNSRISEDGYSDYELSEIERSILDRKKALQREQALLDDAEQELHRRKQSLSSRGNSLLGLDIHNEEITHNPFDDFDHHTDNTSPLTHLSLDPPSILPPLNTTSTSTPNPIPIPAPINPFDSVISTPESPRSPKTPESPKDQTLPFHIDREELWAVNSDDGHDMEFPPMHDQAVSDSEESWSEVGRGLMETRLRSQGSVDSHDFDSAASQTQHSEDGNMSFDMMSVSENEL